MTKKQIETLKINLYIAVEAEIMRGEKNRIGKEVYKLDQFLSTCFDLFLIPNYKKVQEIRKEILTAATARAEALRKEYGVA